LNAGKPAQQLGRYSGLRLLRETLPREDVRAPGNSFWVMPSAEEQALNLKWLQRNGFEALSADDCYLAPRYHRAADGSIEDPALLALIEARRPMVIFLNVGGGVQEQLGWYLRNQLSYRPAILCTGAAIAFLTGGQADIPPWADRFYLGWLLRTLQDPKKFGRRYWDSIGLVALILRHGANLPLAERRG
jgi:hypothetical protein